LTNRFGTCSSEHNLETILSLLRQRSPSHIATSMAFLKRKLWIRCKSLQTASQSRWSPSGNRTSQELLEQLWNYSDMFATYEEHIRIGPDSFDFRILWPEPVVRTSSTRQWPEPVSASCAKSSLARISLEFSFPGSGQSPGIRPNQLPGSGQQELGFQ
jgi:hypothetical protein